MPKAVRARIAAACARVERDPAGARLLPVSKTVSEERIHQDHAAGCRELVENRMQEAQRKAEAMADLVIALGGPIGAFDEGAYSFLAAELHLIEQRLASGRPLLGICLGAQSIARLLGVAVTPMGFKEIGFGTLTLTDEGRHSVLAPLAGVPVLHWHGDRFELPAGSRLLASTERCAHQAYAVGDTVLGLQFHLEADASQIERWIVGHCCELAQAGIDPCTVRADVLRHGAALKEAARRTIGDWLDRLHGTAVCPE